MSTATEFNEITTFDILKHLIFKLGQDFNGNFYPNHIDFYICFGMCHTENGCIYIASGMLIIFIIDLFTLIGLQIWYMVPLFIILILVEILLLYGIKKENRFYLLPHLIASTLSVIISLLIMLFVFLTIINPKNFFFKWVMDMFNMSDLNVRLACLLFVLILGITVVIQIWVNWTLYVHYCYLKSVKIFGHRFSSFSAVRY